MDVTGIIPLAGSFGSIAEGATRPMLGTALALWAVHNLARALPLERIVVVAAPAPGAADGALAPARRAGVRIIGPEDDIGADRVLLHDPAMPFCSRETVAAAIERGAREVATFQTGRIERLLIESEGDLELARAVALGLRPDHPCIAGVRRWRMCSSRSGALVPVRAVISDVDGVLTDGRLTLSVFGPGEGESRSFHMQDGMGVRLLTNAGVRVGWISAGEDNGLIRRRAAMLSVAAVDVGPGDKGERFERMCRELGVPSGQTLYIGDDVNDLPAMDRAGLTACPADARPEVRAVADLPLETRGGGGCFREAADIVLSQFTPA